MTAVLNSVSQVEYFSLTGTEFDAAIKGVYDNYKYVKAPWLEIPKLKYYIQRSALVRGPDKRQFFLSVESKNNNRLKKIVGILELQESPYDESVMWLKYITVFPGRQGQGIAKKLVDMMVVFLKSNPHCLERSKPTEDGKVRIKGYIDKVLTAEKLLWTQS